MFEQPTVQDFSSWIEWHLSKRRDVADRAITGIERQRNAAGQYRSGGTNIVMCEELAAALEEGTEAVLGELKRAATITKLDRAELRRITGEQLDGYLQHLQSHWIIEKLRGFALPGATAELENRLAKMTEALSFKLRQFDVGFLDPREPEKPDIMSNKIHIEMMTGGAVQQATEHSRQQVQSETTIQMDAAKQALPAFEDAIDYHRLAPIDAEEIKADLATIRAQLEKAKPSASILREAGRSLRNIIEGAAGGAIIGPTAAALWKALGIE